MTVFPFAHAGTITDGLSGASWLDLANHCLKQFEGPVQGIGLLYVTDPLGAEIEDILEFLRKHTGLTAWRGAVAPAICATGIEYFDLPAMALMVMDVPDSAASVFPGEPESNNFWLASNAQLAIVHADPRQSAVLDAIPELAKSTGAYLVGALTTAAAVAPLVGAVDAPSGLAGILFTDEVPVATGLTQGCSSIGPVHTITSMEEGIVSGLDDRRALEVLKEDVGELLARDLRRLVGYVHAAIPVSGSDTADYLVRNLVGFDAEQGWVAVAEELNVGDRLMFVRRDAASAVEDMQRMLSDLKRRAGTNLRGAVYHSCVARGPHQFGPGSRELSMIAETFGDIPVIGFFGNGEISHDRLYTYTGLLTVFPEPEEGQA
ncbi:MAG: FIST C-terminal domain-containing protein [Alphaproteobacteria bacterium]|nr:FIST C-terminal domain-containing protein [Alphaproteobacteria bacterium]